MSESTTSKYTQSVQQQPLQTDLFGVPESVDSAETTEIAAPVTDSRVTDTRVADKRRTPRHQARYRGNSPSHSDKHSQLTKPYVANTQVKAASQFTMSLFRAEGSRAEGDRDMQIALQLAATLKGRGKYQKTYRAMTHIQRRQAGNAICEHLIASLKAQSQSQSPQQPSQLSI